MFPRRIGNGKFLLRPNGREVRGAAFPNAAHSVRWPLARPTLNNPLGEHNVVLFTNR